METGAITNTGARTLQGHVRKLNRTDKLQQISNLGHGAEIDGVFVSVEDARGLMRLEEIRIELREERISYGELIELERLLEAIVRCGAG